MQAQDAAEIIRTYTRDPATQRLTELLTQRVASSNAVLSDRRYSYLDAGAISSVTDAASNGTDTQCASYDYDQRLTAAWTPATGGCTTPSSSNLGGPAPYWQSYSYDSAGDRASITRNPVGSGTASVDNYAYATVGSALAVSTVTHTGASTDSYGYDQTGNTTSRPGQSLTYDAEGRLATLSSAGSTQSNVYDADGNLLTSTDSTGTTAYLGDTEVHVAAGTGAVTSTRSYTVPGLGAVAERTATSTGSQLYYLDADQVGTVNAVVNTTINTPTYRFSDPFGATRGTPATGWPDQHDYLNAPTSAGTGLTQLGARAYDPMLGAFLSVDPVLDPASPQSLNGYGYASGNPITLSDPTGLHTDDRSLYGGNDSSGDYNPAVPAAGGYVPPPGNNSNASGASSSVNQAAGLIHSAGGTLDTVIGGLSFGRSRHGHSCWDHPGSCGSNWFNNTMHVDTSSPDYLIGNFEFDVLLAIPTDGLGDAGAVADIGDSDGLVTDILRLFNSDASASAQPAKTAQSASKALEPLWAQAPHNGFLGGTSTADTLQPGTVIDRYGKETGRFFSPAGTALEARSLPPNAGPLTTYKVLKPLDVQGGIVASAFGQPGGGVQYMTQLPVSDLIEGGFIKPVTQ